MSKQLVIAIVLGILATILNQVYLKTQADQLSPGNKIQVILAKKEIRAGTSLTTSLVEKKSIPEKYAPKGRVTDMREIEGQEVAVNIAAGDYITQNDIAENRLVAVRLSEQVDAKDGSRAITIPVDELNSLSRSLTTSDRIDILFTFSIPGIPQKLSVVLLQNVPIISTGGYSAAEQERGESGAGKKYGAVTLKLSAFDAMRLNYARQNGQINVLLRNSQDSAALDIKPITSLQDVLSPAEKLALQNITPAIGAPASADAMDKLREQFKEIVDAQKKQGR